jgi:hypothetical protein
MEDDGESDDDERDDEEEESEPLAAGIWNWSGATQLSPYIYDRAFLSRQHIMITLTEQPQSHGLTSPNRVTIFERSPQVPLSRHTGAAAAAASGITLDGEEKDGAHTTQINASDSYGFGVISLKSLLNHTSGNTIAFTASITHGGLTIGELTGKLSIRPSKVVEAPTPLGPAAALAARMSVAARPTGLTSPTHR